MTKLIRGVRTLSLVCLCILLLAPGAEAGRRRVFADFDADGRRDRVTLDAHEPWIVRIWLSATRSTHIIRSAQPLRDVTVVDLNGDRRPELIAINRARGVQVWAKAPDGFVAYAHRARPPTRQVGGWGQHRVDDTDEGPPPESAKAKQIDACAVSSFHWQTATAFVESRADQPCDPRSALRLASLSPRPPPAVS
jgi:hypothetical protein